MQWKLKESLATRVILVRHGESTYNALGLYQGCSDKSVLTEKGRLQARQTGELLRGVAFDAIYTSSLQRAQETAKEILTVIAPDLDPKIINVVEALRETDLPAWQGLPFQDVQAQFPAEYRCWKQRPHEFCMKIPSQKVGEEFTKQYCFPALEIYDRVSQFWQEVLPLHAGQTLLFVTHGGTNRALINTALGVKPEHYHTIGQSNCGISILNFPANASQPAQLEAMNLTSHIESMLSKNQEGGLRLLLIPSGTINPNQIQNLAQLLKDVTINFSISGTLDNSHAAAKKIIRDHPETMQLQVFREDFYDIWQHAVDSKKPIINSSQLITGLVISCDAIIQRFLSQILGMNSDQILQLQLQPGAISSIHYPHPNYPPVIQAINVSGYEQDLVFGSFFTTNQLFFSRSPN